MGNIAPPLEKPFFSFSGGESIKMKSIQGDDPEEARQVQRMDQAMQDDNRLGLAKNQQWTRTTETSKLLVASQGNIDLQKIEQFPPEVYRTPAFPPQEEAPTCPCYDSNALYWGGAWWGLGSYVPPGGIWGVVPPNTGFQMYVWADLSASMGDITSTIPDCVGVFSCWLVDITNYFDQTDWTAAHPACDMEVRFIDPKYGEVWSNKWTRLNAGKWDIVPGPIDPTYGAYPFIIFAKQPFLNMMEPFYNYYEGPTFECGPEPWSDADAIAGLASPLYLWCNGVRIAGIPYAH